jgi:hypothetical protein
MAQASPQHGRQRAVALHCEFTLHRLQVIDRLPWIAREIPHIYQPDEDYSQCPHRVPLRFGRGRV